MLSYVNRQYGVGFSFPRQYSLKSGDDAQLSWKDLGPFQMDFVHPGGVTLAAVELPGNSYPGTDFKSAFVNLSVNPGMTSEACTQFSSLEKNTPAGISLVDTATNDREGRERKDWRNRLQHSREFCGGDHEVASRPTPGTITPSATEPATNSLWASAPKAMATWKESLR